MPTPTTPNQFLELVQRSDLIDPSRWADFLSRLTRTELLTRTPLDLAQQMVQQGYLTEFQAEQLLQGKYRGFNVGKYKVLERLGVGAMGTVYLCEHPAMRRRVAVKVLPPSLASSPHVLARFRREAKAMAAIDHVNLVQAHDIDQDGQMHFLVMDYVDGVNLQQLVLKVGPLPPLRAAHYIRQAALGLQHAHEQGLVHRDIKPGNLLVDRNGTVRILDLGLARFYHDHEDLLTLQYDERVMLGSVDFVAPEQVRDSHSVDIRADIYGLGATFYFLLAGHPPFPEGTKPQKLSWHQQRPPQPIAEIRSDVPPGLVAVLDRMLAKNPAERYATPAEVAAALAPFTQEEIPPPTEEELPVRSLAARGGATGSRGSDPGSPKSVPAKPPTRDAIPVYPAAAPPPPPAESMETPPPSKPRWTISPAATPSTPRPGPRRSSPGLAPPPATSPVESPLRPPPVPPPSPPPPPGRPRSRTLLVALVVLTLATVVGVGAGWVLNAAAPPVVKTR